MTPRSSSAATRTSSARRALAELPTEAARPPRCGPTGTRSSAASRPRRRTRSASVPENLPGAAVRAPRCSGRIGRADAEPRRRASRTTATSAPTTRSATLLWHARELARELDVDPEIALRRQGRAASGTGARRAAGRWRVMDEQDRAGARPADPRLARQPDRRGRRDARVGRDGPGRRALGRLHRRVRGGRAARRRPRVGRQGRRAGGRQRQRRDRRRRRRAWTPATRPRSTGR